MASPGSSREFTGRPASMSGGPAVAFVACTLMVFAAFAATAWTLQPEFVLPAVVGFLFGLAALVALAAYCLPAATSPARLSYWDVAGALTFIGIGLSVLVEPEQVMALVARNENGR